jgi:hypothetical protein
MLAPGKGAHIGAVDQHRQVERTANGRAETLIRASFRTELVIEVRKGDETKLAGGIERPKQVDERDRVGSAGNCCHDARGWGGQRPALNRAPDPVL